MRLLFEREVYRLKSLARHPMQRDTPSESEESDLTATIVICTRNRPALLRECLEGIAHLTHAPDEVIVVDNTSGDGETEAVAREFAAIYTIEPIRARAAHAIEDLQKASRRSLHTWTMTQRLTCIGLETCLSHLKIRMSQQSRGGLLLRSSI